MRRNRDFGNNNKPMTGPLMTSHLRDLDIELELLKRKREIIQQEQNMLSRLSRQNNYEHPSNSYNRHDHGQYEPQQVNVSNFANLYDVPGGSRNFRQQGFKRPAQTQWQAPNPPKRFNAPRAMNPWQNDNIDDQAQSRKAFAPPKPRFSQPIPLMSIKPGIGQRIKKDNRHQPRRDFQPTKVTKPNAQPAKSMKSKDFQPRPKPKTQSGPAMKLATCPPAEAKKLVSETMKAIEPQADDQILHPDRQPSLQMKGRMELALGSLLKEMRQEYCTDPDASEYFVTQFIQRIIKHTIRLRIRDVMMGKVIGAVSDILDNYRKIYPKETDLEILNVVRDAQAYSSKNLSVTHLIESDDPLDFFRKNMQRVLSFKLEELFSNLQTFYENKDIQIINSINKLPDPEKLELNKKDESKKEKKKLNEKSNLFQIINNFFDSVPSNNEFVKALGGRLDKAKHYIDFMDKLLEERLPKVLPKFRDVIISILYSDKEFFGTKAMIMTEMKKKVKVSDETVELKINENLKIVEPEINNSSEVSREKIKENYKSVESTKDIVNNTSAVPAPVNKSPTIPAPVDKTPTVLAPVDKTPTVPAPVNETLTVPAPVNKSSTVPAPVDQTPTVLAPVNKSPTKPVPIAKTPTVPAPVDKTPTVPAPVNETLTVPVPVTKTPTVPAPVDKTPTVPAPVNETLTVPVPVTKTPTVPATGDNTPLYYVKLLGRPKLPARAVIYDFLNKFNPKSIKKHKSINNLLVIAFDNKEDFHNILEANESLVGDATIIIKASEQITANKETPVQSKTKPENLDKSANTSLEENTSSSDLDHQITDLLSSIRKADEKYTGETNDIEMTEKIKDNNDKVEIIPDKVDLVTEKVAEMADKVDEANIKNGSNGQTDNKEIIEIENSDKESSQNEQPSNNDKESKENIKDLVSTKMDTEDDEDDKEVEMASKATESDGDKLQKVEDLKSNIKESGISTPTRTSSRLPSTPSTVRTRRANRLAQNNSQ